MFYDNMMGMHTLWWAFWSMRSARRFWIGTPDGERSSGAASRYEVCGLARPNKRLVPPRHYAPDSFIEIGIDKNST